MSRYFSKNAFPIIIEILFILVAALLPGPWFTYINFLFYALLFGYFKVRGEFSLEDWQNAGQDGEQFWIPVLVTTLASALCFLLTGILFPSVESGLYEMAVDSWPKIILFGISALFLAPVAEEMFFRKSLILGRSRLSLALTVIFSLFLFALEHGIHAQGILTGVIWGIPLTFSYLYTRNIYVPMTAHLIANFFCNGLDLISLLSFQMMK